MRPILDLAGKDLRLLARDKVGVFFTFFFPVMYAIFFGVIFSGMGDGDKPASDLPLLVVDLDRSESSEAFVRALDAGALSVTRIEDATDAKNRVRSGKSPAFLVVPKGFGEARERMFYGDPARLELGVDPAQSATRGMIQGLILEQAFSSMQEMFTDSTATRRRVETALREVEAAEEMPAADRLVLSTFLRGLDVFLDKLPALGESTGGAMQRGWQPIEIETVDVASEDGPKAGTEKRVGPRNPYEITFPQGIVWGIMGCAAGFGISIVTERTGGTLVRLRMAPISRAQVLGGKALACFLTTCAIAAVLLAFGSIVCGVRPDSLPLLAVAIVSVSLCFVGVMMLLAVIGKTEAAAGGIGWAALVVFAMIGGGMIPLLFMPPWLTGLSDLSPVKWSILALEGAIWRGFTTSEMLRPAAVLTGIGAASFLAGALLFRRATA